jgi:histidinol dehydrogenase
MRRFDSSDADFDTAFTAFLNERRGSPADVDAAVEEILEAGRGDVQEAV